MDVDSGFSHCSFTRPQGDQTTVELGHFIFKVFCSVSKKENFFHKDIHVTIFPLYKSGHRNNGGDPEIQVPA